MSQRELNQVKAQRQRPPYQRSLHQAASVKRRGRGWQSAVAAAVAIFVLGGVALYHAVERFPEYFGPVVAVISTDNIVGPVTHVRDGDTIEVAGVPIRFGSLDCAERDTAAGQRATARMRSLVAGQTLICHLNGRTSYDRKIGSCTMQDGRDLAGVMIGDGYCGRFW